MVTGWNAPLEAGEAGAAGAVVAGVVAPGAVAVAPGAVAGAEAGVEEAGAATVNWVPVTTVTSAPSVVGPRAVMTEPVIDPATASAAAWSAAVLLA